MPEIKNSFLKGKMNKDLDERLIPNGEYRDALNVDVDYSEGSDVGALKNILGNTQRDTISLSGATCIGYVKDTENDKIYWFITSSAKDLIAEWDVANNSYDTILVDSGNVLNFNTNNLITGVNVLDGVLYFTDDLNEPRQVDIEYWRGQTSGSTGTSTGLAADKITVIKKGPFKAPTLNMSATSRGGAGTSGNDAVTTSLNLGATNSSALVISKDSGDTISGTFSTAPNYKPNDIIILTEIYTDPTDGSETKVEARIKLPSNYSEGATTFTNAEILTISEKAVGANRTYTCILQEDDPLFELKFARFAYRYKYGITDSNGITRGNQYSVMSPFSNVAFLPDATAGNNTGFEFNAETGMNLGMVNSLRNLKIQNINDRLSADVQEIDILYKDSVGTNVYIVDTIKRTGGNFPDPLEYEVKDEQIFKVIPSNQLLRLFDSVPKKAKAQDITANRLIYGNYVQNFNLLDSNDNPVNPTFDINLVNRYASNSTDRVQKQSIKSNRTYQLGVVYYDEYGRQTPVLTDSSGVIKVPLGEAKNITKLTAKVTSNAPTFATDYKYFIKEISELTYNFVVDGFYQDRQGYIYMSVPSSEINKVDIDDVIILKKKSGNEAADTTDKFKILDKLTTPPDFLAKPMRIKYEPDEFFFGRNFNIHDTVYSTDGGQRAIPGSTPLPNRNTIVVHTMLKNSVDPQEKQLDGGGNISSSGPGVSQEAFAELKKGNKVKFVLDDEESDTYEIASSFKSTDNEDDVEVHFKEEFGSDVRFIYEDGDSIELDYSVSGGSIQATKVRDGVKLCTVEQVDESGKPEYQGRFFLKIKADTNLLDDLRGSTNFENLNAVSSTNIDGKKDDDHRKVYVRFGGKKLIDSTATATPATSGGFGGWGSDNGYGNNLGFTSDKLAKGFHVAFETTQVYHHSDSKYPAWPFLKKLKKDNYMQFDNSGTGDHDASGTTVQDSNYYKIVEVEEFGPNNSNFRKLYAVKFDRPLQEDLTFYSATNGGSQLRAFQATVFEYKDDLVGIKNPPIFEVEPKDSVDIDIYYETQESFTVSSNHGNTNSLSYFNCFSFENGVESFIIRDDFNAPPMGKGVRVSTIFEENYQEERIKSGLIFSQLYNGKSGTNHLNQFIIAEPIIKDLNPQYGSIQLLHTRYNDIIAYCEDKVLKILTNKDALFNADGNTNVTSNTSVLGQAIPYNSNYGISTNPESFADFTYRAYFTDKKNGAVIRHSADGMEAVSDYGMKDYFKDNLRLQSGYMHGSYDERKNQYNLSLPITENKSVSFSESIKGWPSRKSFVTEGGVSINNKYFTFKNGHIYEHHVGTRNNFYGAQYNSEVKFVFNEAPANMKNFRTLNYEGDTGWTCPDFDTDQQDGSISTFVNKENKYFGYVRGVTESTGTIDFKALNVQGIGNWATINLSGGTVTLTFAEGAPNDLQVGDVLYYVHPSTNATTKFGPVTVVNGTEVRATYTGSPPTSPAYFVFYVKNASWETSGLLGYYADVTLRTTSTDNKELYSAGSEISISS